MPNSAANAHSRAPRRQLANATNAAILFVISPHVRFAPTAFVSLASSARAALVHCLCAALLLSTSAVAQQTPPPQPPASQKPPARTPPQVKEVLPSYEGQNVSSVEIAGRPDLDTDDLRASIAQKQGEPFSQQKVDASIAALKATGRFQDVQLQVVPDINGVRVLLVL